MYRLHCLLSRRVGIAGRQVVELNHTRGVEEVVETARKSVLGQEEELQVVGGCRGRGRAGQGRLWLSGRAGKTLCGESSQELRN